MGRRERAILPPAQPASALAVVDLAERSKRDEVAVADVLLQLNRGAEAAGEEPHTPTRGPGREGVDLAAVGDRDVPPSPMGAPIR